MSRRTVLGWAVAAVAVSAAVAVEEVRLAGERAEQGRLRAEVDTLQDRVRRLAYSPASGGGINRKLMPDPRTGQPTVPMDEVFSFDRNHLFCRVDTNPQAFKMPTHQLGAVTVEANRFFMAMASTTIDQFLIETLPDGKRKATLRGGLSCATEVGQATTTLGSKTAAEHANYLVEAIDGGVGGGPAGDRFAFTVFFDPKAAPVNFSIFGPQFTFTGEMVEGEVTIVDPRPTP